MASDQELRDIAQPIVEDYLKETDYDITGRLSRVYDELLTDAIIPRIPEAFGRPALNSLQMLPRNILTAPIDIVGAAFCDLKTSAALKKAGKRFMEDFRQEHGHDFVEDDSEEARELSRVALASALKDTESRFKHPIVSSYWLADDLYSVNADRTKNAVFASLVHNHWDTEQELSPEEFENSIVKRAVRSARVLFRLQTDGAIHLDRGEAEPALTIGSQELRKLIANDLPFTYWGPYGYRLDVSATNAPYEPEQWRVRVTDIFTPILDRIEKEHGREIREEYDALGAPKLPCAVGAREPASFELPFFQKFIEKHNLDPES